MTLQEAASSILSSGARIIAIDGRSAAGKTTLASLIAEAAGGSIVHMDDFFLPLEMRTPERLSAPGGNVHSERFMAEVLPHLARREAFSYRRFDCSVMDYAPEPVAADASGVIVIEGAYSLSPAFGRYYDLSVFCDHDPQFGLTGRTDQGIQLFRRVVVRKTFSDHLNDFIFIVVKMFLRKPKTVAVEQGKYDYEEYEPRHEHHCNGDQKHEQIGNG